VLVGSPDCPIFWRPKSAPSPMEELTFHRYPSVHLLQGDVRLHLRPIEVVPIREAQGEKTGPKRPSVVTSVNRVRCRKGACGGSKNSFCSSIL